MKAMIWKELRENFKWAILACLALLLAEIYALSASQKAGGSGIPLCGSTFLLTTSLGCALIGAALGTVQILPELRRDQWAALLHRPVPRDVIFFGKTIAGVGLYGLATALPLLASVCYVAAPRNFAAPFVPGTVLPALTDMLMGIAFYFAAVLVCLIRGRWFGAKVMVLLSMLAVLFIHAENIYGFVVVPLVALLVTMLAAWAAMVANGSVRTMPPPGRISYALMILVGAQIALLIVAALLESLAGTNQSGAGYDYGMFRVTTDGQVFYLRERSDNAGDELTDMHGKIVTDEKYTDDASYENFCQSIPIGPYIRQYFYGLKQWRAAAHYVWSVGESYDTECWYFLVRGKYLVGYDVLSRRCIGYYDQQGFKSPGERPSPFSGVCWAPVFSNASIPTLLAAGSKVYLVDFSGRNASVLLDAGNQAIVDAERFGIGPGYGEGAAGRIAVTLENEIRIFDGVGKPLFAIAYPHDPKRWQFIEIAGNKAGDRLYLISEGSPTDSHGGLPDYLDEYDAHGHLLDSYSHPAPRSTPPAPRLVDRVVEYSLPLGPVFLQGLASGFQDSGIPIQETWRRLLLSLSVIALLLAGATFFWARKTGSSTASALRWAAISFLFGPAGLLTFRLATDWPVHVPCPACRRKRPVDTDRCPHCSQGWTLPKRNGTEILDIPTPVPNP